MWDSWKEVVRWNPSGLFSLELLKAGLAKLFLTLDYIHSECKIVHTGWITQPFYHLLPSLPQDTLARAFGNTGIKETTL